MTPPPEQRRLLTTTVPGPRSVELMAPEEAAVATGVGTTMPVLAAAAGGGAVVDVDGNSPADLGTSGNVLRLPPVTIGDGLLAEALDTLAAVLAESRRRPVAPPSTRRPPRDRSVLAPPHRAELRRWSTCRLDGDRVHRAGRPDERRGHRPVAQVHA